MVQKRPFYDEELYNICSKHQKQVEYNNELSSISEFVPPIFASSPNHTPGECGLTDNGNEGYERFASDIVAKSQVNAEKGVETIVSGRSLNFSWTTICSSEETSDTEMPEYIENASRTVTRCQDIYSLLLRCPPQKSVPIGSNHQAEIPEGNPCDSKTKSKLFRDSSPVSGEKDENPLIGTCVIPMPELEHDDEVGNVKNDCSCLDQGSIRCVRQHIVEAREKVRRLLGIKRFEELGFCDMGEQVSEKWTKEEEQLYHEVVFSNPLSLGQNFWNCLSAVFPSRTKKDIVCYYFNVFMLRRRAEQNRSDSMSIADSDIDEWHEGGDDYEEDELEMTEEDEDSVIESPAHQDHGARHKQSWKDNAYRQNEGAEDDISDDYENSDLPYDKDTDNVLETCNRVSLDKFGSNLKFHLLDKVHFDRSLEQEVQDDSCTSSDAGVSSLGAHVKAEDDDHCPRILNRKEEDHVLEPCNINLWDAGYMIGPKSKVNFLPTCSMIEEVFGDGSWNYKAREDKSLI